MALFEEKGFMYSPAKQRLLDETKDLAHNINELNDFMATEDFFNLPREQKDLLYEQQRIMSQYIQILGKRLDIMFSKEVLNKELSDIWEPRF